MRALVPQVRGGEQPVRTHLPLEAQVPLLHVMRLNVERHAQIGAECDECCVLLRWEGEWKGIAANLQERISHAAGRARQLDRIPEGRNLPEALGIQNRWVLI